MTVASMTEINFSDFEKIQICAGTVLTVELNAKAKKPAYILTVDFGVYGIKTSSAQITHHYTADELINSQIVAVLNFPSKRIAGVKSEILILGCFAEDNSVVLLRPTQQVSNGARVA